MSLPERADNARRSSGAQVFGTHAALRTVQAAFAVGAVEGKRAVMPPADGGGGVDPLALAMAGAAVAFVAFGRGAGLLRRLSLRASTCASQGSRFVGIVLKQTLYLPGLHITTAFGAALLGATMPGVHGRARDRASHRAAQGAHGRRSRALVHGASSA